MNLAPGIRICDLPGWSAPDVANQLAWEAYLESVPSTDAIAHAWRIRTMDLLGPCPDSEIMRRCEASNAVYDGLYLAVERLTWVERAGLAWELDLIPSWDDFLAARDAA